MNIDIVGILLMWPNWTIMVYWPLWAVPIYLIIRREKIRRRFLFIFISITVCFVLNFIFDTILSEFFFNNSDQKINDFSSRNVIILDQIVFLLGAIIPLTIVHLISKTKPFLK